MALRFANKILKNLIPYLLPNNENPRVNKRKNTF